MSSFIGIFLHYQLFTNWYKLNLQFQITKIDWDVYRVYWSVVIKNYKMFNLHRSIVLWKRFSDFWKLLGNLKRYFYKMKTRKSQLHTLFSLGLSSSILHFTSWTDSFLPTTPQLFSLRSQAFIMRMRENYLVVQFTCWRVTCSLLVLPVVTENLLQFCE